MLATTYITEIYETDAENNGLVNPKIENEDGTTIDTGIRYAGSTPKNYVYYNCKDEVDGVAYGEEGYEYNDTNCEVWRIIGVFDTKDDKDMSISRIKMIRNEFM